MASGELDDAKAELERLSKKDREHPETLDVAAQLHEACGDLSEAADTLMLRMQWVFDEAQARPLMLHALDLLVSAAREGEARKRYLEWSVMDPDLAGAMPARLLQLLQGDDGP